MKRKVLVICIFVLLSVVYARLPESSYWYPNDIIDWEYETDGDALYNRSSVPLAKRVGTHALVSSADERLKVMALSIMNSSTSGMPSQGVIGSMKTYPFTFWQYVDYLVAWAGSAGEGIIVPPSADVTDAGHKNGVPVLGTIFFPPNVYGGRRNWVDQLLQKEDGRFIVADKLIEITEYYGFDGWFINQETTGCNDTHALLMKEFIQYVKTSAPWITMVWYDSMTNEGNIEWQGEFTDKNAFFMKDLSTNKKICDEMFIDFRWQSTKRPDTVANSLKNLQKYGIDPNNVFVGFDLQASGYLTAFNWPKLIANNEKLMLSLGLYCPSWSYYDSKTIQEFWTKEESLWIGEHSIFEYNGKKEFSQIDWGDYKQYRWRGIASFVNEKTPLTGTAFSTSFCAGHGKSFYINGERKSQKQWYNRSLTDIFPTYRWKVSGKTIPEITVDYDDAFYGGTSLKFNGSTKTDEPVEVSLYAADLEIKIDSCFNAAIKTDEDNNIDVYYILKLSDGKELSIKADLLQGMWKETNSSLSEYNGKKITEIGIRIVGKQDTKYSLNLGKIALIPQGKKIISSVKGIKIDSIEFREGLYAQLLLHWQESKDAEFYEIYRVLPDQTREFVWASYNNYTYISDIKRFGKEDSCALEVIAVDKNMNRSLREFVVFNWPSYPVPKADFEISNTIAMPGEKIRLTSLSSEVTEQLVWILPGATPGVSYEVSPEVTYEKEGIFPVTLKAINSEGESIKTVDPLIVITKKAANVKNMALNKNTYASSHVPSEKPSMAVDGTVENNSKWCAVGDLPHWLVVDFEKEVIINRVIVKHAQSGNESPDMNTQIYKIQVSNDAQQWSDVVSVDSNGKGVTEDSFAPVKARYLRLFIDKPTQGGDKAARIYEVEVYGLESY